jgi:hypothetical protein
MIQCHDKEKDCVRQETMWKEGGVAANNGERRALFSARGACDIIGTAVKCVVKKIKYCLRFRKEYVFFA